MKGVEESGIGIRPEDLCGAPSSSGHVWRRSVGLERLSRSTDSQDVACKLGGRLRSLRAALLIEGAPTAAAEVAPIIQLSRMVWKSTTCRKEAAAKRCSVAQNCRWWVCSQQYTDRIVANARYPECQQREGWPSRDCRRMNKAWTQVRGPLAAAALTARRIGWQVRSPIEVIDDRGVAIYLSSTSPVMVKEMLVNAVMRHMERQLANKWAQKDACFAGRRVCLDSVKRTLRSWGLTNKERGALRAATRGAVMTNRRAHEGEYEVKDLCPLCDAIGVRFDIVRSNAHQQHMRSAGGLSVFDSRRATGF